ncbi:MAG: hypothetical protein ACFCUO_06360 [Rhodospirillales bacterium]
MCIGKHPIVSATVVCVLAGLAATPATAVAQDDRNGVVNAVAFELVTKDIPVIVRTLDNTDENLVIKREFATALAAAGYRVVGADTRLVLSFESREEISVGPAPRPDTTIRLRDRESRLSTPEQRNIPTIIETPRQRTQVFHPSRFRIEATLDDRTTGTRLWQGWAVADMGDGNRLALAQAMVPALVDALGQTVREQAFVVPSAPGR